MTGSVYVTEVQEALYRCLLLADVVSMSLVLSCSAICAPGLGSPTPGPKGALQRARGCGLQLLEGTVEAALQVRVSHHQDALLVSRHQADLLRNARIQLWEGKQWGQRGRLSQQQRQEQASVTGQLHLILFLWKIQAFVFGQCV